MKTGDFSKVINKLMEDNDHTPLFITNILESELNIVISYIDKHDIKHFVIASGDEKTLHDKINFYEKSENYKKKFTYLNTENIKVLVNITK